MFVCFHLNLQLCLDYFKFKMSFEKLILSLGWFGGFFKGLFEHFDKERTRQEVLKGVSQV